MKEKFFALVAQGMSAKSALMCVLPIHWLVDMAVVKDTLGFRNGKFHIFMN